MAADLGCCASCHGSEIDTSAYETNGKCWDCFGTGHCHPLTAENLRSCEEMCE